MKNQIGTTAGKIWKTLHEQGEYSITQLTKVLKEKSATVNQALGWLAKEGKIRFLRKGGKEVVTLKEDTKKPESKK